jgi:hypothetical protein
VKYKSTLLSPTYLLKKIQAMQGKLNSNRPSTFPLMACIAASKHAAVLSAEGTRLY